MRNTPTSATSPAEGAAAPNPLTPYLHEVFSVPPHDRSEIIFRELLKGRVVRADRGAGKTQATLRLAQYLAQRGEFAIVVCAGSHKRNEAEKRFAEMQKADCRIFPSWCQPLFVYSYPQIVGLDLTTAKVIIDELYMVRGAGLMLGLRGYYAATDAKW